MLAGRASKAAERNIAFPEKMQFEIVELRKSDRVQGRHPGSNKSPRKVIGARIFGDSEKSSKRCRKDVGKSSAGCPGGPPTSFRHLFDDFSMRNDPQGGAAAKPPPPLVGCGRRPHPFFIKMLSKSPLQDVRGPRGHPAEDFLTTFGRLLDDF